MRKRPATSSGNWRPRTLRAATDVHLTLYRDKAWLQEHAPQYQSLTKLADAYGWHESTVQKWWRRHGLESPAPPPSTLVSEPQDEWLLKTLKKAKDSATVEDIADAADVSPRRVREALERLGERGFRIAEEEQTIQLKRLPTPSDATHRALFQGEDIAFGVISDTHLGSKHCRLDELHMAYGVLEDEGITTVYHPGDLVCGMGIFPGQVNDIALHTYDEQISFATANYPRVEGITTHIIAGNHDIEGAAGKVGLNPVVAVCNQRPDIVYAGDYRATFKLEQGTRIYLLHPKGGMGYAADYKLRKIAEGFEAGAKPNVVLCGHYHRRADFEARGIQMLLTGCFEGGGSFGARLGMSDPAVGFYIVRMRVADDGSIVKWAAEWHKFWPGRVVA